MSWVTYGRGTLIQKFGTRIKDLGRIDKSFICHDGYSSDFPNGFILFNTDRTASLKVVPLPMSCSMMSIGEFQGTSKILLPLLKDIIEVLIECDYSAFFTNTVYPEHMEFLKEAGFVECGTPYRNSRTNRVVKWYQYIVKGQECTD